MKNRESLLKEKNSLYNELEKYKNIIRKMKDSFYKTNTKDSNFISIKSYMSEIRKKIRNIDIELIELKHLKNTEFEQLFIETVKELYSEAEVNYIIQKTNEKLWKLQEKI